MVGGRRARGWRTCRHPHSPTSRRTHRCHWAVAANTLTGSLMRPAYGTAVISVGGGSGAGWIPAGKLRSPTGPADRDAISSDAARTDTETATMRAVLAGSRRRLTPARSCGAGSGIRTTRVPIGDLPSRPLSAACAEESSARPGRRRPCRPCFIAGSFQGPAPWPGVDPDVTMTRMSAESMRQGKHR